MAVLRSHRWPRHVASGQFLRKYYHIVDRSEEQWCFNSVAASIGVHITVLEKKNLSFTKLKGGRLKNLGSEGFYFFYNRTLVLCLIDDIISMDKSPEIFPVCSYVDTRHCLMDKSLEICVFCS